MSSGFSTTREPFAFFASYLACRFNEQVHDCVLISQGNLFRDRVERDEPLIRELENHQREIDARDQNLDSAATRYCGVNQRDGSARARRIGHGPNVMEVEWIAAMAVLLSFSTPTLAADLNRLLSVKGIHRFGLLQPRVS